MLAWRLSFGLITLLVLLIAIGGYGIWLFLQMGSAIDSIVETNYKNINAIHQIRVAASRINSAYLIGTTSAGMPVDLSLLDDSIAKINSHIQTLERGIYDYEGIKLLKSYKSSIKDYESGLQNFVSSIADKSKDREAQELRLRLAQSSVLVNEMSEQVLQHNERAMFDAQKKARQMSVESIWFLLLASAAAMVIALYTSFRLHRLIVVPLRTLTTFSEQVGSGANSEAVVPVPSDDDIGRLTRAFNDMAARVRTAHDAAAVRISELTATIQTTLATFPDPIFVINNEGTIALRNPAAQTFSTDLGLGDGIPLEVHDKALEVMRTREDYAPTDFREALSYRIRGQKKAYLPRFLAMKNNNTSIQGVAIVLQDVTRFEFIDSLKTNLVSTVSHELKTPLTSVRMALHVLLEKKIGPLNGEQVEMLDTARDDAERLLRTINNLLDMTRLEEGGQGLQLEALSPQVLISAASDDFTSAAAANQVKLVVETEPNLPSVSVDRQRIIHVFRNLLSNALKFSPTGGTITLKARRRTRDPEIVRFSVIDHGPGVPSEFQAQVFQKFFRIPGQTKTGAGLGLSIARQIVEAHEGRIGVLSPPDKGSEFFFDLPIAR